MQCSEIARLTTAVERLHVKFFLWLLHEKLCDEARFEQVLEEFTRSCLITPSLLPL